MMDSESRAVLSETLIREGVGLLVLAGIVWWMGPGQHQARAWWRQIKVILFPPDPLAGEMREFREDIERHEREQARTANRKPAGGSPCGCGQ